MRNDIEIRKLFGDYSYCLDNILQRSYEWEKGRVVKFINDICANKLTRDGGGSIRYNVGDFITYREGNAISTKCLFDGQQRITTLTILLANILHHNPSTDCANSIKELLYVTKWEGAQATRVKRLSLRNGDDIILRKIIDGGLTTLTKEESKSCLAKNYEVISVEFTDKMGPKELNDFYSSIINNASYFERECESRQEGIRQFNNLNGWQQPLKRSRLGISTLYSIYRDCNRNDENVDEFLCALSNMNDQAAKEFLALFIYYKSGDYKENGFSAAFETLAKKCDVVKDATTFYNTIYHDIINRKGVFDNPTLNHSSLRQVYVDLFTDKNVWVKDIPLETKIEVYKKFEWGYVSNIVLNAGSAGRDKFKGILPSYTIEGGNLIEYVVNILKTRGIFISSNELFDYRSTKNDLFTRLLLRVEDMYGAELNRKEPVKHIDMVTAEHIHPKNPKNVCEYHCDNNLTYTIGNFTLMGKSANSSNSNDPFVKKRELYRISPYLINSQHLFTEYQEWNDDAIRSNAEWIIEKLKRFYDLKN